jgi:outer membrane protein assembly factor BamD (BamD/ComL family)
MLALVIFHPAYALDLDKIKTYFLAGDYKSAIAEGEKLLAAGGRSSQSDELYYLLGLSYLKDGNYLRSSDIFEIILTEFSQSNFKEQAKLGLADTYFLRVDYAKAEGYYKELLANNPNTGMKAALYYRLSQVGFKKGDTAQGKDYLDKLKSEFPQNPELLSNKDLYPFAASPSGIYYTVQVGAFANQNNAKNLLQKLIQSGYLAYIEETTLAGQASYRVRVGKSLSRQEMVNLESKLSGEGYPTKICP